MRSELGRGLSTQATRRIALVVELDNALYQVLMAPIHDELLERDYRMVLLAERGDGATRRAPARSLRRRRRADDHTADVIAAVAVWPRVACRSCSSTGSAGSSTRPSVTADNVGGARAAAELLIGLGHTRIAAIVGPEDTSTARDREAGFRSALADAGVALPTRRVVPPRVRPRERP